MRHPAVALLIEPSPSSPNAMARRAPEDSHPQRPGREPIRPKAVLVPANEGVWSAPGPSPVSAERRISAAMRLIGTSVKVC